MNISDSFDTFGAGEKNDLRQVLQTVSLITEARSAKIREVFLY